MINELLKKIFLKPISLIVVMAAILLAISEFFPTDKKIFIKLGGWLIVAIVYCLLVYKANKLPHASKKSLGVLFVFHTENENIYKDATFNLIENFKNVSSKFNIQLTPVCINVNKIKKYSSGNKKRMIKLLQKTNCIFCVDIVYQANSPDNASNYETKINIGTLHPEFSEEDNKFLIGELNRVSEPIKILKFNKDKKLDVLKIAAVHLNYTAKYIISLVFILSGNFKFSDALLSELYQDIGKNGTNWFAEMIKKAYFNSCNGMETMSFDKYNNSLDIKYIDDAEKYLNIMNQLFPDTYGYHLDIAWIDFYKYRNITKAKQHIAKCKEIGANTNWMYSDAFLSAYTNENFSIIIKKYEKAINTDGNIIEIIHFIENVLDDEPQKYNLHFALALLYHSFGEKRLTMSHLNEFTKHININNKEKCLKRKIKEMVEEPCQLCELNNCDMCDKIA